MAPDAPSARAAASRALARSSSRVSGSGAGASTIASDAPTSAPVNTPATKFEFPRAMRILDRFAGAIRRSSGSRAFPAALSGGANAREIGDDLTDARGRLRRAGRDVFELTDGDAEPSERRIRRVGDAADVRQRRRDRRREHRDLPIDLVEDLTEAIEQTRGPQAQNENPEPDQEEPMIAMPIDHHSIDEVKNVPPSAQGNANRCVLYPNPGIRHAPARATSGSIVAAGVRRPPRSSACRARTEACPAAATRGPPSAAITWLGSAEPAAQALPVETATPVRSSATSSVAASTSGNARLAMFGGARRRGAVDARARDRRAERRPRAGRAGRRAARSRPASPRRLVRARARSPTMPATFSVPARRPGLLTAADDERLERRSRARRRASPTPGRAADFVRRERQQIRAEGCARRAGGGPRPGRRRCET